MPEIPHDAEWQAKIREIAPEEPPMKVEKPRKVLTFSLATGFKHWCIPHTASVVRILGDKTGAYECVESNDIEQFLPENLEQYDAVVLNNTCPDGKDRDTFRDVLINKMDQYGGKYKEMPLAEREELAKKLYRSLVSYVSDGGGLVLLHGGITAFMYSDEFSAMVGGSFHYHPLQEEFAIVPVGSGHPLLKPFGGEPFVHVDEPYYMNRAYSKLDFLPLLEIDMETLEPAARKGRGEPEAELPRYVAWVRPHKQGRVFFCSPSHNAQSFEKPELLGFILGGMQYALGDLKCDDKTPER
ncbi:MAG: ThuA domain-containing protein [Verrucomicrobiota bacterium]